MSYRVIYAFADLTDSKYKYEAGDKFPRRGLEVSEERILELSGRKNRAGRPLIEEVKEPVKKTSSTTKKKKKEKKDAD